MIRILSEKKIENSMRRHIDKVGGWSLKYPAGASSLSGIPDLLCYYKSVGFLVEVKAPKNYVISELQKAQIRKLRKLGIIAIASNDLKDVKQIINLIDIQGNKAAEEANRLGLY